MTDSPSLKSKKPNRLIHASSPYLLQHAYNPVDWYEWSTEAFERAKLEDKPVLVSIGYSSCHWCHVMEHESFENHRVASVMNDTFVCIKVDREERPDIDQVYMEAVQTMGINGGWPLNVFLTPNQKPFYGGTYFPPQVWIQVLQNIHQAYHSKKTEINESAEEVTRIISSPEFEKFKSLSQEADHSQAFEVMHQQIEKKFDFVLGGLDKAPKFIMPSIWLWLLRYHYLTKSDGAFHQIMLTLTKILDGGIYDQVGGGFARYSVDAEWFAPHFEKMLYDNAQLTTLYAEAFSVTHNPDYKRAVFETYNWLCREMTHPEGGFYSALDADSEGEEGKYYVWTKVEIETLLGKDADLFCEYFGVTSDGNWEKGKNILKRVAPDEPFIKKHHLTEYTWHESLSQGKAILLHNREKRIKPGLDDKILSGWNAMMITGLLDAYHVFGDTGFLEAAKKSMEFLENGLMDDKKVYRSYKDRRSTTEGFLEDYAYLIKAYIKLYQAEFNERWLNQAEKLLKYVIENFLDQEDGLFFFTSQFAEKLIARKKEVFDNVIPSSNSVMAINLHHMSILLDKPEWKIMADRMVRRFVQLIQNEPGYMSNWGIALTEMNSTMAEVAIVGKGAIDVKNKLNQHYLPFALFMGTEKPSNLPLLKDKVVHPDRPTIYVCRNYSCKQPTHRIEEALTQIATVR